MGVLDLIIFGTADNIKKLTLPEHQEWHFRIRCSHCKTDFPKEVYFSDEQEFELKGEKSHCNFLASCKNCNRTGGITVLKGSNLSAEVNENGKIKGQIGSFQCRGIELVEFNPGTSLTVVASESGVSYQDVDVSDVWVEYDEKSGNNLQLEEVKFQIVKGK